MSTQNSPKGHSGKRISPEGERVEATSLADITKQLMAMKEALAKLEGDNKELREKQAAQEKSSKFLDACRGTAIAEYADVVVPYQESSEKTIVYAQWVQKFFAYCPAMVLLNKTYGLRGTFFFEVSKNNFNDDMPLEITLAKAVTPPSNSRYWRYTPCHSFKWGGKLDGKLDFTPVNALSPYFINAQGITERRADMPQPEALDLPLTFVLDFAKAMPKLFAEADKKMTEKLAKKIKDKEDKEKERMALKKLAA